jgi:hypothetical protein
LTRKSDASDACPFPPDRSPPPKTASTNLLEYADRFFEGWRNYLGLVTMMGLILAYSLIVVPPPLISSNPIPDTWNTELGTISEPTDHFKWIKVREPDYNTSKQLVLEGDQVLRFTNQTVEFGDLVLVKDNARIILRNSTIIVPDYTGYLPSDLFKEYAGMVFNGSARLEAYDSVILRPGEYPGIGFIGSSSCILENTVVANCSLKFDESATLQATGSIIYMIEADRSSALRIADSYIDTLKHENWWRQRWANPVKQVDASVYLEDSKMRRVSVRIVNSSSCHVTDIAGHHDYWNIYDAFGMNGATMNLTLRRSSVAEPLWISTINSELNVSDAYVNVIETSMSRVDVDHSNVTYLALYSNSSAKVDDSNIYYFGTGIYPIFDMILTSVPKSSFHQNATIMRTRIERMRLNSNCILNFTNVYVGDASLSGLESNLKGSVTWGQNISDTPYLTPYDRFALTQVFEVQTQGRERVLPGVSLVLTDKDGNMVWEGASDENSKASFNLTFCQYYPLYEPYQYVTNYMDEWRLTATSGDESRETGVALFKTGSPIVFEFDKDKPVLPVSNAALTYASVAVILLATALKLWRLR